VALTCASRVDATKVANENFIATLAETDNQWTCMRKGRGDGRVLAAQKSCCILDYYSPLKMNKLGMVCP
jgi:hypothetical protein